METLPMGTLETEDAMEKLEHEVAHAVDPKQDPPQSSKETLL